MTSGSTSPTAKAARSGPCRSTPSHEVRTIVGTAGQPYGRLFTFGDVDGQGSKVRLQHPLDVAYRDGTIYVADTYNNKIKAIKQADHSVRTLAGTLQAGPQRQPAAVRRARGAEHRRRQALCSRHEQSRDSGRSIWPPARVSTLTIQGLAPPSPVKGEPKPSFKGAPQEKVAIASVKPVDNQLQLHVKLDLPAGYKINPLAPMRYYVDADKAAGPVDREALGKGQQPDPPAAEFDIRVPLAQTSGEDVLKVSLGYYYCQDGKEGLCKTGSVVWTVPVKAGRRRRGRVGRAEAQGRVADCSAAVAAAVVIAILRATTARWSGH